jgi:outer membrane protein insertion porin family
MFSINKLSLTFLIFVFLFTSIVSAQYKQEKYTIAGISVEGNRFSDAQTIIALSGLRVGEEITYPGDSKLQKAIVNLWKRKQFSDVNIIVEKVTSLGIFLKIEVKEFARLEEIQVHNNEEVDADQIKKTIGKIKGDILSPYDIYKVRKNVKDLYKEEGLIFANVDTETTKADSNNYVNLVLEVDEGVEFYVESIKFNGNSAFDDDDLESEFEETHTKSWWQFWRSSKFDLAEWEKDKDLLIDFYKNEGFRDAEILKDTVIYDEETEQVSIDVDVYEGNRYFIRNISFVGNTVYESEQLLSRLDFEKGDPYNYSLFQQNLKGNEEQSDALSLYLDNGYLFANMNLVETRVPPDSIDIMISVTEQTRVKIRKVDIVGNTKTKDKVIRRELYTRPNDYFSRAAIIRSVRALGMLNYFNPEALRPDIKPVDNTEVDIVYSVEERSTDTFNASIGYAGTFGLTLAVGFTFNNFSLMEPLRGGSGQVLNFNWEFGQASRYKSIALGFTEPWLFNEPTTVGFNIYSTSSNWYYIYERKGIALNIGRRFTWPDDYFRGDWSIRIQENNVPEENTYSYFRPGLTNEVTISQTFSRISLNNLYFPTNGSKFSFGTQWAMGAIGLGNTDFLKAKLSLEMSEPIMKIDGMDRLILFMSSDLGYITGIENDTTMNPLELFTMGGSGLSGMMNVTPLRGYDDQSIGPYYGGRVMARHIAELRFAVSLDPMPIFLFGFAEAGNVWNDLRTTDPFDLKRSAGIGVKLMLNPIGIIGFSYGYGFDSVVPGGGPAGWKFLFHLGQ